MEQDYVPEVDRPGTEEEQNTLERKEGTTQGLTDPECVEGVFSELRAEVEFSEVRLYPILGRALLAKTWVLTRP